MAIEEEKRLRKRQRQLEEVLSYLEKEEKRLLAEMAKVGEQVAYYDSLAKDMKKELEPPKLSGLLRSFRKT